MAKGYKSPNCGICGELKIERNGRMVCLNCCRRYAQERIARAGPQPITDALRATKRIYRNRVRPSGLTNEQVRRLKKKYALSEGQYVLLMAAQGGLCAICKTKLDTELVVDHDHSTKEVRGLLCQPCNTGLGFFKDNAENLLEAAQYIKRFDTLLQSENNKADDFLLR